MVASTPKTRGDPSSVALLDAPSPPHSIEAEQAVLGGLLLAQTLRKKSQLEDCLLAGRRDCDQMINER